MGAGDPEMLFARIEFGNVRYHVIPPGCVGVDTDPTPGFCPGFRAVASPAAEAFSANSRIELVPYRRRHAAGLAPQESITQPARRESVRSHASACEMMVARSSYRGCHPSVARTRSHAATICAGSPARRPASSTL